MTKGVGGSTIAAELERMSSLRGGAQPIGADELRARVAKAQSVMRANGVQALHLDSSTSTFYFTGLRFKLTERLHSVVIPAEGDLIYVSPAFEEAKLRTMIAIPGEVRCWEEHESPTALVIDVVRGMGYDRGTIAVDPATPFFTFDGLRRAGNSYDFVNGAMVTSACRMIKSPAEIELIKRAMALTLEVQRATARILHEGITTTEVADFINRAHVKLGADAGANVSIVLFGEPTAYPHGVPYPQTLKQGDMVLVDIGCTLHGYQSDLTRTYVFGEPSARQREVWDVEKRATDAVFAAARLGATCESLDAAARKVIAAAGFGPDYALPGLPHRTGHGVGLDVHEEPYIVRGDRTPLAPGMCFSNEPTICIYGEFGVRLEDHIYMTEEGARWFTPPSPSIDDPFRQES
ncbi:Xaa-Pro peptidase family protein [Terrarubrum flagellatum]|uniref:M24 family metallopeptidase n=1 Tax=Terrirubrum flagellatum TaxID=2895980 RepID=UPI0031454688